MLRLRIVNYELRRMWYYTSICLEVLRKHTTNFRKDGQSKIQDSKLGAIQYELWILSTKPRYFLRLIKCYLGDQVKEDETGGACSSHGRDE